MKKASELAIFIVLCLLFSCALASSEYKVTDASKNISSVTLRLTYTGKDDYYLKPTSPIIKDLIFTFRSLTFDDFTFKIIDANNKRYEVPQTGVLPIDPFGNFSFPLAGSGFVFDYTESPFDFRVIRK
jgi:hypothetical protein